MYCLQSSLAFVNDRGRRVAEPAELVVDLGNAMLLALFAYKPEVRTFVSRARIPELEGRTSAGKRLPVIRPAEVIFMDAYAFRGQPVLLLENRMRLPGYGFLGIRFFERFRVIFDFRRSRLRIAEPLSAADTRAAGPDCSRAVLCSPDATRFLCVKPR